MASQTNQVPGNDEPVSQDFEIRQALLRKRFDQLAARWKTETKLVSALGDVFESRTYCEIVEMGWKVVPLLLEALKESPDHWFVALHRITGHDPIPPEHYGIVNELVEDWLRWGRQEQFLS